MVSGQRVDGGAQGISFRVRRTIQSIKEIVQNHSDADIYDALKESNMDPNETAQKLLNQDPFHEVRRRRDRKKEVPNPSYVGPSEVKVHADLSIRQAKPNTSLDQKVRRIAHSRNPVPGVCREFRVVRDNRVNLTSRKDQNEVGTVKFDSLESTNHDARLVDGDIPGKRSSDGRSLSQGLNRSHNSGSSHSAVVESSGRKNSRLSAEVNTSSNSAAVSPREVQNVSPFYSARPASSGSVIGVYSSSLDPVHVPSPDNRSASIIGAIGREIGVVGVRRPSDFSSNRHSVSTSSASVSQTVTVSQTVRVASSTKESLRHSITSKNGQPAQAHVSEPVFSTMSKSLPSNQYNSRGQQPVAYNKVSHSNMEWKPKHSKKTVDASCDAAGTSSLPSSYLASGSTITKSREVISLSQKLIETDLLKDRHVIIPEHLRVPDFERSLLIFGSFEMDLDSSIVTAYPGAYQDVEELQHEPDVSPSLSGLAGSGEDNSADDAADLEGSQGRTSQSNSPASATVSEKLLSGNEDSPSPHDVGTYIGLVQDPNHIYNSDETHLQGSPKPPGGLPYNPQSSYDGPFFRTAIEDSIGGRLFVSTHESTSVHAANSSSWSTLTIPLQQQQQQQQPLPQVYPPLHISHLPNYVPFRHIFSPVYSPPVLPNYSTNPAYPHPSNANNYVLMPGGVSHLSSGGTKYAPSQYKPLPAGTLSSYGSFANPSGYAVAAPGAFGNPTAQEDASRIKYKENNLYGPNHPAETPDLWAQQQTPRELQALQSAPYYNLPAQTPHAAAFLPAPSGHTPFNTAHPQYPGLYHPQQAPIAAGPHALVRQQVLPGMGSPMGVGVAAPGPQVGAYQQPQMGHLNWNTNF